MATFVLIHGSWHGGWCWERIVPLLHDAGHRVIAPDLPGYGRGAHARNMPSLHDILEAQSEPVVLVGHSSGGMLISAAAAQHPDKIAVLVYLAAFLLPPGVFPPAIMRDDAESLLAASLVVDEAQQTVSVKRECARAVFYTDCSDDDAAWAIDRLIPEPIIPPGSAPLEVPATSPTPVPRVYIETLHDRALGPTTQKRMYVAMPCARVCSLPTDHSPFLSAPAALAAILVEIGQQFARGI